MCLDELFNSYTVSNYMHMFSSLTTEKQTTKVSSAKFSKNVKSKLYHIEKSKHRGQTVSI